MADTTRIFASRPASMTTRALLACAAIAPLFAAAQASAQERVVGACTGVSLPPSVLTNVLSPVLTGITGPTENVLNSVLGSPLLGLLLPPLNLNVTGLLDQAAAGDPITLQVLDINGNVVGPNAQCRSSTASISLDAPAGIAIGGNRITGLGAEGTPAFAADINAIAFGNGARAEAGATGSIALGQNSNVTGANSVALGAGSVAARGPLTGYTVLGLAGLQNSVGEVSIGAPGALRQLTNVAPGTAATDAATVGQVTGLINQVAGLATNAVQYDGAGRDRVTLAGTGGTVVGNVAAGTLAAGSTEAVNGAQLFATNAQVAANTTAITNVTNLLVGSTVSPVQYSNAATPTIANGGTLTNDVTLAGANPAAPVGLHNVAAGAMTPTSTDAVNGQQLYATNQIAQQGAALGANSVQYDANRTSVTFINTGNTAVTVRNVAAGTATTDAVNVGQLQAGMQSAVTQANTYTDTRLNALGFDLRDMRRDMSAGTSAGLAAAGMPQANEPGRTMIAVGGGTYRGQSAVAFGASTYLSDGHSILRLGGTYDSQGYAGANAGFGYQF